MNGGLPRPLTEQAQIVSDTWSIFLIGAALVAALIAGLLIIIVFRFRRRSDELPEQVHYRVGLEIAYTVLPLIAVAGLFVLTLTTLADVQAKDPDPDLVVEVTGFQWQWQFAYPSEDVTVRQPNDTDPPVLVVPKGAVVEFRLESADVIHSFWVPGFLTKLDLIPGRTAVMQANVTGDVGVYDGVCAEFCGVNHTTMRFDLHIVDPADFDAALAAAATSEVGQ